MRSLCHLNTRGDDIRCNLGAVLPSDEFLSLPVPGPGRCHEPIQSRRYLFLFVF
eukprot:Gb_05667 [translate_table: standard]